MFEKMKILESENKDNLQKLEKKIRKVANWNELKNAEMVYITEEKILYLTIHLFSGKSTNLKVLFSPAINVVMFLKLNMLWLITWRNMNLQNKPHNWMNLLKL